MGELAKQVGQIIYDVAGPAAQEIGEMIKDEIRPYRAARQMQLAEKTARRLQEAEIKPVAVAPKILLSVFENAGLEDDEEMHDRWATLLANAATPGFEFAISIVFIEILKQLSPREAVYLDVLVQQFETAQKAPKKYSMQKDLVIPEEHDLGVFDEMLGAYADTGFLTLPSRKTLPEWQNQALQKQHDLAVTEFNVVLANMERLGLLGRSTHVEQDGPRESRFGLALQVENYERHHLTSLGYRLVLACRPPKTYVNRRRPETLATRG
jgi:hypothetical protein